MTPEELLKRYELKPDKKDVQIQHDRQLFQARFTTCGRFLIACGYDATIQRWDMTGEPPKAMAPLLGHNGWVQCMDFAWERKRLLTADSWGQLACWSYEAESPQPEWTVKEAHPGWIRALAVSPDGSTIATGGNGDVVKLWSAEKGELLFELPHARRVFSLRFHPDGKALVSGDLEGVVRHWDLAQRKELRQFDAGILYSHDVEKERIQHCGGARGLSFDAEGTLLACGGQKEPGGGFATGTPCVLVFDWKSGELKREMPMGSTQDGFAYDARFHPDGFVMATSCAFPGKGHVWFWRPEDDKAFFSTNRLPNGRSLSLHPDGQRIAFLTSQSPNGNGRALKEGQYLGGTAAIRIMHFPAAEQAET